MGGHARPRTTVSVGCAQVRQELCGVEYSKGSPTLSLTGSPGSAGREMGAGPGLGQRDQAAAHCTGPGMIVERD